MKKIITITICLLLFFCCTTVQGKMFTVNNLHDENYTIHSDPVYSYLTVLEDGTVMKFQANRYDEDYDIQYYDTNYHVIKVLKVKEELYSFGGYYYDGNSHYIVTGQDNENYDDKVEVYRVTKYDENWNCTGTCSLCGVDTYVPFDFGTCRMTSDTDHLYIYTCQSEYATDEGICPQYSQLFTIDPENMTLISTKEQCYRGSYNQFIVNDEGSLVTVDQSNLDKAIMITKDHQSKEVLELTSKDSIGGLETSSTGYLIAGKHEDNICIVSEEHDLQSTNVVTITDYDDTSASTPQLVKISQDTFILLWEYNNKVQYCKVNANGERISDIYTMKGSLSDVKPVLYNENIVWYTQDDTSIIFYYIDASDICKNDYTKTYNGHDCTTILTSASLTKEGTFEAYCNLCDYCSSYTIAYPKYITLSNQSYIYNGDIQKPSIKVIDSNNLTISSNNYKVTYSNANSVEPGSYEVTITFTSNLYRGKKTYEYKILPVATELNSLTTSSKSFTAKWNKQTKQVTGYQVRYSTNSKFTNSNTITITNNQTTSKKITGLKCHKKYYVKVRTYKKTEGTKYYSSWSKVKSITTK